MYILKYTINLNYNKKTQTSTWAIRSVWGSSFWGPSAAIMFLHVLYFSARNHLTSVVATRAPHPFQIPADIDFGPAVVRASNWQSGCLSLWAPDGSSCQLKSSVRLQPAFVSPPTAACACPSCLGERGSSAVVHRKQAAHTECLLLPGLCMLLW